VEDAGITVAVLFDLEGTLVQTIEEDEEPIRTFRAGTREKLVELGIPSGELEGLVGATLMRNKAIDYVNKHFSKEEAKQFHAEVDRFMKDFETQWAEDSKIFPDTLPALSKLRGMGCRMGVVTNTSRDAANRELSMHGIAEFFEVIVTREDVRKLKPDPEGTTLASRKLGIKEFFFVGDLIHDLRAAEKAGGTTILIDRNSINKERLRADYVVKSLIEVPDLIQHLTC
jgi:HAD superfamily hydrolase (TIGR01549 family)